MKRNTRGKQEAVRIPVRRISENYFVVESASSDGTYRVRRNPETGAWACECRNFLYRLKKGADDKRCRHIRDCIRRIAAPVGNAGTVPPTSCPRCGAGEITKSGQRKNRAGAKQQYRCKGCGYKFVQGDGFTRLRFDQAVASESLGLVMDGVSYRNIAERFKARNGFSHVSVRHWIARYAGPIREYADALRPELGDTWSVDELFLNVKDAKKKSSRSGQKPSRHLVLWSVIDPKTRFLIATHLTETRNEGDARAVIGKALAVAGRAPRYVMTDSYGAYPKAVRKVLGPGAEHVPTLADRDGFNLPIERYHNEIRERLKARRGLGNLESARAFAELLRIHHNFVRPHTGRGMGGRTPAEVAGIDLNLGDDKYLDLIRLSAGAALEEYDGQDVTDAEHADGITADDAEQVVTDAAEITGDGEKPISTFADLMDANTETEPKTGTDAGETSTGSDAKTADDGDAAGLEDRLGDLAGDVSITAEGGSVRVAPRGWIGRETWTDIARTLEGEGFCWVSSGRNGRWIRPSKSEPNFMNNLGRRTRQVRIANEGDSIRVAPRKWLGKRTWREINDILRLHKFSWLPDGKDGCWIRPLEE